MRSACRDRLRVPLHEPTTGTTTRGRARLVDVTEPASTDAVSTDLGRLAGTWHGTNGFRMMPTDEFHDAPATATLTTAAGGQAVVVTYTWVHPDDGPQEGVLLLGSPDEHQAVTAAWVDSWHQHPAVLMLAGVATDGRLEVTADYGGGWLWTIAVEGDVALRLTMLNVVPPEQATDEVAAGPYPVMVAELHRTPESER